MHNQEPTNILKKHTGTTHTLLHIHTHTYTHIYTLIYILLHLVINNYIVIIKLISPGGVGDDCRLDVVATVDGVILVVVEFVISTTMIMRILWIIQAVILTRSTVGTFKAEIKMGRNR